MGLVLTGKGYGAFEPLLKTGVSVYNVVYKTSYPQGHSIEASGVLFVPENYNAAAPTVIYTHGTCGREEAPSLLADSTALYNNGMLTALMLSSAFNCVVLQPDYTGYGASADIVHPYLHKRYLPQSCLDFMEAYKHFASAADMAFNPQVVITGYSEGGYVAVALHEMIQENPASGLRVLKTLAGSGPYDNTAFALELMAKDVDLSPIEISSYLWVLDMYKRDYGYARPYAEIFSAEDNARLEAHNYQLAYLDPMQYGLQTNPVRLFNPAFIPEVLNGADTSLLRIAKENSLTDFMPADSLIFVYGGADTWVLPVNTENAYSRMSAGACPVKKYFLPEGTHPSTYPFYVKVLVEGLRNL